MVDTVNCSVVHQFSQSSSLFCCSVECELHDTVEIFVSQIRQKLPSQILDLLPPVNKGGYRWVVRGNQGGAAMGTATTVEPAPLRTMPLCAARTNSRFKPWIMFRS